MEGKKDREQAKDEKREKGAKIILVAQRKKKDRERCVGGSRM